MKAIAVVPDTPTLHWIERPEPAITAPHEVKISVVPVGICGTDIEQVAGGRALAPCGESDVVAGHGVWSKVQATGEEFTRVKSGNYAVFTVRRGLRQVRAVPHEPLRYVLRQLVLENQVMVGSVNASRDHFQMAVDDLSHAQLRWGKHIVALITQRHPAADFKTALAHHGDDEIKVVLERAQ